MAYTVRPKRVEPARTTPATTTAIASSAATDNEAPPPSGTRMLASSTWKAWLMPIESTLTSRSEEHTSELQSRENLVCRLLLEKKKTRRLDGERTFPPPVR